MGEIVDLGLAKELREKGLIPINKIVSLELAKELKAKGYSKPCAYYYQDKDLVFSNKGLKKMKNGKRMNHNRFDTFIYSAPTIRSANLWLKKIQQHV